MFLQQRSIRSVFSLFLIIITLGTAAGIFILTYRFYIQSNKKGITDVLQLQARQESAILNYQLNIAGRTAANLADMAEVMPSYDQELLFEKFDEKLKLEKLLFGIGLWLEPDQFRAGQKYYGPYMYRDQSGENVLTWEYSTPAYDYLNWDWYRVARNADGESPAVHLSPVYYDSVLNTFFITTSVPFYRQEKLAGVATIDISIREIAAYVKNIKVGYQGFGFLLTGNDFIVGRTPFLSGNLPEDEFKSLAGCLNQNDPGQKEYLSLAAAIREKSSGVVELAENRQIASFARIGDTGLSLVLVYPEKELYGFFYQTLGYYLLLLCGMVLVCLFLTRLTLRKTIEQPIGRLLEKVSRVMQGDFSQDDTLNPFGKSRNEFDTLGQAMNKMAASLDGLVHDLNLQNSNIRNMAYFDALTGLPNRAYLNEQLSRIIREGGQEPFSVFFMDLDNFKVINDTAGHGAGDQVLLAVAKRLQGLSVPKIWISRFGGDEFILIARGIFDRTDCETVADAVHHLVSQPIFIDEKMHFVKVSIGISMFPDDGTSVDELLRNADTAMFAGKASGRDQSVFFESRMNEAIVARSTLENRLRLALDREEFILHYQPLYNLREERIIGFEALVRWNSPGEGMVPPGRFIQLMEENRLIKPLGKWVLHETCRFIRRLIEADYPFLRVSVNVSVIQMRDKDFGETVLKILEKNGVPAANLEIEITESKLMEFYGDCIDNIRRLWAAGVRVAIDDFGSGYSSFSYLNRMPISALKIDRSFIGNMSRPEEAALAEVIILVAHKMGLEVVAEGVETEAQYCQLKNFACDILQGYLICRPIPAEAALSFLEDSRLRPASSALKYFSRVEAGSEREEQAV